MNAVVQMASPQGAARPLADKVVLITGGGRGLGAAIASAVAMEGAIAIIADINGDNAHRSAQEIARRGQRAEPLVLDVSSESQVQAKLAALRDRHGRVDVIVNNAGTDMTQPVSELATSDWERVLATNLHGPFLLAKHAIPYLRESRGHIVNIASTAAKRTWANAAAYHASKWGLLGLSHALHAELRSQGIKVSAVVAGGMRTPFLLDRFPDIDPTTLQDPADVARAVVFVLSTSAESVIPEIMVIPMRETSWP